MLLSHELSAMSGDSLQSNFRVPSQAGVVDSMTIQIGEKCRGRKASLTKKRVLELQRPAGAGE